MAHSKEYKANLEKIKTDAESVLRAISEYKTQIESIFAASSEDKSKIVEILGEIEKRKSTFDTEISSIIDVINDNPDLTEDTETLIANIESIKATQKEILTIYRQIYGIDTKSDTGETIHTEGIKDKLEKSYSELTKKLTALETDTKSKYNEHLTKWNKSFNELESKIESLLPGATAAGLASAYADKVKKEESELGKAYKGFIIIIAIMVLVGTSLFIKKFAPEQGDYIGFGLRLMLFGPLIWIGIYQNKKLNQAKKIIEEYSHKESVMKTFDGLLKQVYQKDEKGKYVGSDEVRQKLLIQTLDAIGRNPADCISDCNKSDNPMIDICKILLKKSKGFDINSLAAILNGMTQQNVKTTDNVCAAPQKVNN